MFFETKFLQSKQQSTLFYVMFKGLYQLSRLSESKLVWQKKNKHAKMS